MKSDFIRGLRHGIPIGLAYLSVSFTFGMKCITEGLSIGEALLISMTNLTSAGQFAGLPLIISQASLMEMALTQFIINLRYALMSLSIGQKLDKSMSVPHRLLFSFANTDEIFAVASSQPGKVGKWYLYGLVLMPYLGWSAGTLIGSAAGTLLPEFVRTALGIAIYGMFIAIILPPAKAHTSVRNVVILSVLISVSFRYIPILNRVSSGFVIIICAVIASAFGALMYPVEDEESTSSSKEA